LLNNTRFNSYSNFVNVNKVSSPPLFRGRKRKCILDAALSTFIHHYTFAAIKLSSVLSDTSGAMAVKLINMLCHGRCQYTKEEMLEACTGCLDEHKVNMLGKIRECNASLDTA